MHLMFLISSSLLEVFSTLQKINCGCFFSIGLTNTVTAVKNAQMAESPLLLMGGAAATLLKVPTFYDFENAC